MLKLHKSSSQSFSALERNHKKRYFGSDLCRVAHEHIHGRCRACSSPRIHSLEPLWICSC